MHTFTKISLASCVVTLTLPSWVIANTCNKSAILSSTPTSQFVEHENGTATDKNTGLMWKKCTEGQIWNAKTKHCDGWNNISQYNWGAALSHVQKINRNGGFAGKNDWRLPSIKELSSIVEDECAYPTINTAVFPDTPNSIYWSSSPYLGNGNKAWYLDFNHGYSNFGAGSSTFQIRLVRSIK